jgi:N-acetylmuramoyl-L-alanine amidase
VKIANHRFEDHWFAMSKDVGGPLDDLKFIVMHYTAGGDGKGTRDYMLESPAEKGRSTGKLVYGSAHVLVDRDGTFWQIVPFNRMARHAGKSEWKGLASLNQYALGIEIANHGWLDRQGDGTYKRADTPRFKAKDVTLGPMPAGTEEKGWENYTAEQLAAVEAVTLALLERYPTIHEIVGHQEIAPGRKFDPGPAFPLQRFKNLVFGRGDELLEGPDALPPERYEVTTTLNIRGGPGIEFAPLDVSPLKIGTKVDKLDADGNWVFVKLARKSSQKGWVHGRYLKLV